MISCNEILKIFPHFQVGFIWKDLVGKELSRFSSPIRIKNNILYVGITSHLVKNKIKLMEQNLLLKLKKQNFNFYNIYTVLIGDENE